jgi:hypothetical protein
VSRAGPAIALLALMLASASADAARCGWPRHGASTDRVYRELVRDADFVGLVEVIRAEDYFANEPATLRSIKAIKGPRGEPMRMRPPTVVPGGGVVVSDAGGGDFRGAVGSRHVVALAQGEGGWEWRACLSQWLRHPGVREEVERQLAGRPAH